MLAAQPVAAHGVGRRGDLPLPLWQFVWAAVIALGISVAAAGAMWTTPRLERAASGRPLSALLDRVVGAAAGVARLIGIALFVVILYAAFFVDVSLTRNIAPFGIFVALWVGLQFVSALFGNVYRYANPLDTIVGSLQRLTPGSDGQQRAFNHWPAAVSMFGFLWLELAYHDPSHPRLLGWLLLAYSTTHIVLAVRLGREWLATGEAFAAFFGIVSALAPFRRDETGQVHLRVPGSGLATMKVLPGTTALILITLGGTSFDGLTRTTFWSDVAEGRQGWELTAINTLGMIWMMAIAYGLYGLAVRLVARTTGADHKTVFDDFAPSLVPIAVGYAVAHYFSLFVLDGGQDFLILLSDPFDKGWDLFGTGDWRVNFLLVSATTIAWVQAIGIIIGHVAGVLTAHDRALEVYDTEVAAKSQYAMVGVMIIYTVGALVLLLGA